MLSIQQEYQYYLKLEKGLSDNSIAAYQRDLQKLIDFLQELNVSVEKAEYHHLRVFVIELGTADINPRSQARIISGIKSFYSFLIYKNKRNDDPTELLESPKLGLNLPTVLSVDEIDKIIATIDLSKSEGQRNKAILEVLYGSGLRVSELINLRISQLNIEEGYMLVEGKGNKQRLVPLSPQSIDQLLLWNYDRNMLDVKAGNEDYVFLNRRGARLTRAMIFHIVKEHVELAGIDKNVSPHTFRHSFATHLLENGANLRAIQQLLGHESITTTELYTHIDINYLKKTILEYHPMLKK